MTAQVKIISGKYRGTTITNTVFPMLRPVVQGAKGDFITVDASEKLGAKYSKIRIMVDDYEYMQEKKLKLNARKQMNKSSNASKNVLKYQMR